MATIKQGYGGKPTHIKVNAREERRAEVWIEQEGVPQAGLSGAEDAPHSETLAYVSLDELLDLRDEINEAIQELVR